MALRLGSDRQAYLGAKERAQQLEKKSEVVGSSLLGLSYQQEAVEIYLKTGL